MASDRPLRSYLTFFESFDICGMYKNIKKYNKKTERCGLQHWFAYKKVTYFSLKQIVKKT